MNKISFVLHKEMTDEEIYKILKKNKNPDLMKANEWKKLRLKELKRTGLNWTE